MGIIDEIVRYKQEELAYTKAKTPLPQIKALIEDVSHRSASFKDKLKRKQKESIRLIAEIKKASPSKGVIRQDLDVEETARIYEEKGASAISVLTEKRYFGGSIEDLETVSKCTTVPLLRKDFIFDPYQIYEARIYGAKATLLIASVIERSLIVDLMGLALELGLDCLVEVHTLKDLEKALYAGAEIVGINNRDLKTLKVDLSRTCQMLPDIPKDRVVVSESGIRERQDVQRLEQAGVDAILVGTVLMESQSIAQTIDTLLGR
jgi:indole-3-glycerol phosphate synthase